jgi:hypothetical protein
MIRPISKSTWIASDIYQCEIHQTQQLDRCIRILWALVLRMRLGAELRKWEHAVSIAIVYGIIGHVIQKYTKGTVLARKRK